MQHSKHIISIIVNIIINLLEVDLYKYYNNITASLRLVPSLEIKYKI